MTADEPDELTKVQGYLDRARAEYQQVRGALVEALRHQPAELLPTLIAHAEEFGTDVTLEHVEHSPGTFSLPAGSVLPLAQLQLLLPQLADLAWELGSLTAAREDLLGRKTIADGRVLCIDGREAVVDLSAGKIRYIDKTSQPLEAHLVEATTEPSPQRSRSRRRDRDR